MEKPNNRERITPMQQLISSCTGAIVTAVFTTPLDVIKVRLQAQQKMMKQGSCFVYNSSLMECLCVCSHCNGTTNGIDSIRNSIRPWYKRPGNFNGTLDAFVKITRSEGIRALWSGLPATIVMAVPATVFYFTSYDQLKYAFGYNEADPSTKYIPVAAGSIARVGAATLISPLEMIRTKMQSKQLSYTQLMQSIRLSIRNNGMLFMMRGLGPSLLRDVPFSAIYWFSYEQAKSSHVQKYHNMDLSFIETFVYGAVSGTIAAVLTLPFDVIKTHRQIELGEAELAGSPKISSTWQLISHLFQQKGFSGIYAGIVPRIVKIAPACAIMISSYEYGKSFFRSYNNTVT